MKICGSDRVGGLPGSFDRNSAGKARAAGGARAGEPADRIELSPAARELAAIREAALRAPEVRAALVEGLRQRIASGEYEPDVRAVARKILEELSAGLEE